MTRVRQKEKRANNRSAAQATAPDVRALAESASAHAPFGPLFFLTQLAAFVRDHCPDTVESLPVVELHLHSAEVLRICHVIGVGPLYVALAVYDDDNAGEPQAMRTELLPYESIIRVTIRATPPTGPQIGFKLAQVPALIRHGAAMTPEDALRAAASAPVGRHAPHGRDRGHE
ncbi:MAG: hypothetical protein LC135_05155 [Phycisphaerae bacterium]|jgi:hypothetical protein|nr:hypothetical protein [Phycisphaerae bacterium]MCZ2399241.1 hypothetical protein [Phycisphaerae bacterium]